MTEVVAAVNRSSQDAVELVAALVQPGPLLMHLVAAVMHLVAALTLLLAPPPDRPN
jgi:hypothetical protein